MGHQIQYTVSCICLTVRHRVPASMPPSCYKKPSFNYRFRWKWGRKSEKNGVVGYKAKSGWLEAADIIWEYAGINNTGKSEGEDVGVIKNRESAHKSGKHTKVEEEIEVEVASKSLIKNKARKLNANVGKSLIKERIGPAKVADKSLKITVKILENTAKSNIIIIKKLKTPVISRTRVSITSNLNNPALVSLLFASF